MPRVLRRAGWSIFKENRKNLLILKSEASLLLKGFAESSREEELVLLGRSQGCTSQQRNPLAQGTMLHGKPREGSASE